MKPIRVLYTVEGDFPLSARWLANFSIEEGHKFTKNLRIAFLVFNTLKNFTRVSSLVRAVPVDLLLLELIFEYLLPNPRLIRTSRWVTAVGLLGGASDTWFFKFKKCCLIDLIDLIFLDLRNKLNFTILFRLNYALYSNKSII